MFNGQRGEKPTGADWLHFVGCARPPPIQVWDLWQYDEWTCKVIRTVGTGMTGNRNLSAN
jgi:hypothetical protein